MTALPSPRIRQTAQNTQYTYDLNRRIHDVKTYPILTPQGAVVLIYGHQNGLTLVWRGGKRLRSPHHGADPPKPKPNGTASDDAVMILDSDDESQPAPSKSSSKPPTFVDKPEFEDSPAADESSAYPDIVQTLDLSLETAALHLAVLPLAPSTAADAASTVSGLFGERMVFAVACANGDNYLVTLPLTPPSPASKARPELRKNLLASVAGNGAWGESLTLLAGQSSRQPSDGLAVNLVRQKKPSSAASRDRSASRPPQAVRVVVAAHSREACGTLRFWDVNVDSSTHGTSTSTPRVEPFQTEYLPSPLTAISFNPSHATQLLAVASPHAVRVYDYALPSFTEDLSDGPFPTQGSWLLSLYPPFTPGLHPMSVARKPIVAAAWIARGGAVLALLADGQWGIWDIDGAAPSSSRGGRTGAASVGGLFGKQASGLRGAGLTSFSASGYLEGTSPLRNPASHKTAPAPSSEFVPMTPHTRRTATLANAAGSGADKLAAVRGGIDILHSQPLLAAGSGGDGAADDESAVIWMGGGADPIVVAIPAVARFWDAQLRRGAGGGVNLFSGARPTRMIRLANLGAGLGGERCAGVAAIPRPASTRGPTAAPSDGDGNENSTPTEGLPVDVLVRGESRFVIVRESDDAAATAHRPLGARNKSKRARVGARSASAIIAYPRPERPGSVAFNLSVARPAAAVGGSLRAPRQRPSASAVAGRPASRSTTTNLWPSAEADDDGKPGDESRYRPSSFTGRDSAPSSQDAGLAFGQSLVVAADAADDERGAEERNVEDEILDIMEIDRELEEMETERHSGKKHVFFEDD